MWSLVGYGRVGVNAATNHHQPPHPTSPDLPEEVVSVRFQAIPAAPQSAQSLSGPNRPPLSRTHYGDYGLISGNGALWDRGTWSEEETAKYLLDIWADAHVKHTLENTH